MYARKLTKAELMEFGITEVTADGRVFKGDKEEIPNIDQQGYFVHQIYDRDENGEFIKIPKTNATSGYVYKLRTVGLHRVMWAWHYGEVPEGMVVDHINNVHNKMEDYYLDNLQLMTPGENLAKERNNWHVREIKCMLNKPRSFYEKKLEGYQMAYEQAKQMQDAKGAHHLRCNVAQTKARLRYYDNHIEEYLAKAKEKKTTNDCHARAQKRRELQYEVDRARLMYLQLRDAYGKDDPIVYEYWGEWKLAIAKLHGFQKENKRA